ncbi:MULTISPECIES: protein kinase domain-containing protein [Synechococcales]|uniref:protein kinase domain-containing protein n=1 Tax=Synechococcus sp. CS-1324 TaxID=2847980 RepID=UPI00223BBBE8|nr:protein kinase [Synechococcus sp. CS-1324]
MHPSQTRHLKVIVFSDVVDSSAQIFADELIAIQRIKEDLAMIRDAVQRHGGCLVKSLGDGILATFDAPTQALEFVEYVVLRITRRGSQSLQHRFGLHTGEIYVNGDDIIGRGVHLASRLQTTAPVNGVAFVQSTYELVDPRFQRRCVPMGPVELKGLPNAVICYAIEAEALIGEQAGAALAEHGLEALLVDTPYRLERPLSAAPGGGTYLVREQSRNRRAVLKLIPCDATNLDALQVEAACFERLRHPSLPRFVDAFEHRGSFLFLQEYIPGVSLQGSLDILRRKQRLAELLRQALGMLDAIHSAGIVHGDLHPANLIPAETGGSPFLVDFGLLKARSTGATPAGEPLSCRPFYSPPERTRFGSLTPQGDLYALGVMALSLYTGQNLSDLYHRSEERWLLEDLVDPELIDWLTPLLAESPSRRLLSAGDALQRLDRPNALAGVSSPRARADEGGLPPLSDQLSPLRKAVLQRTLTATYGPVVELLLESSSSTVSRSDVEALRQRLVGAGLSLTDVDAAFREAQETAGHGTEPQPAVLPAGSWQDSLVPMLRQRIGPIADVLFDEPLRAAIAADPPEARRLLLQSAVPPDVVDELLSQAESLRLSPVLTVPAARPPATPLATEIGSEAAASAPDLEKVLVELIGPIAATVLASLGDRPKGEQLEAVIVSLEGFGVEAGTLQELRRRLNVS